VPRRLAIHDQPRVRLQATDGPALVDHLVDELLDLGHGSLLPVRPRVVRELVLDPDQLESSTPVDHPGDHGVLYRLRPLVELEEPAGLLIAPTDQSAGVARVDAEGVHELDQDLRLLDGVEVLALQVLLGLGQEPVLALVEPVVDGTGDLTEAGQLGSAPTPLPRHDAKAPRLRLVRGDDDRLADARALEALGQRLEASGVEVAARLAFG